MSKVIDDQTDRIVADAKRIAGIFGAVLCASALLPLPDNHGAILGLPSICPFYDLTGLPCPGCGLTRSFVCFAHGRFLEAFHWNLLGPPIWCLMALLIVRAALTVIVKKPVLPVSRTVATNASWAGIALLVGVDIIRIALLTAEHRKF